ncbi:hypothetical protein Sjap_006476 [Stephania japonica]|uniref:Agglutinin domain-containing protein n=1 Tax=Stephania japonica TaxID=461633 RepID=A0AAP0PIY5_9MAGN
MALAGKTILLLSSTNRQYLRYIDTKDDAKLGGFLRSSAEGVRSPYARFVVEKAKNFEGLVHIKCCFNNKYWMRRSETEDWIVASADKPDEDQSKWSCTLFEPINVGGDDQTFLFRHTQLGQYTCLWPEDIDEFGINVIHPRPKSPYVACLYARATTTTDSYCAVCKVVDWDTVVIFPDHVAFKGDNGCYLSAQTVKGEPHLQFSLNDIADSTVGNEVYVTYEGAIRLKSKHFDKFWRCSRDRWILGDASEPISRFNDSLFWPVKISNNVVALRNVNNNLFCKRLTADNKTSCLSADATEMVKEAQLHVEEHVKSRYIYDVEFRTNDSQVVVEEAYMGVSEVVENATHQSNTVEVKISYKDTKTKTWKSSVSVGVGGKITFKTRIPFIADGKIVISGEAEGEYEWGETETTSTTVETAYTVVVPPMSKMKVTLLATKGICNVPFSYHQRDQLWNGKYVTQKKDDGMYNGVNFYNFYAKSIPIAD